MSRDYHAIAHLPFLFKFLPTLLDLPLSIFVKSQGGICTRVLPMAAREFHLLVRDYKRMALCEKALGDNDDISPRLFHILYQSGNLHE